MIESVIFGEDWDVIPLLISLHSPTEIPEILDVTYNTGTMWKGIRSNYNISTLDIDPAFETDYVGDFRDMSFIDKKFDIVVFDPPHLPTHAASENSSKIWEYRYGITNESGVGRDGDNVSPLFTPFFSSAKKILISNGIILAKISDMVHNHKYQWQHIDLIISAQREGLTPCDMIVKKSASGGKLRSSKWENQYHTRRCHSYWIVLRNSNRCERPH